MPHPSSGPDADRGRGERLPVIVALAVRAALLVAMLATVGTTVAISPDSTEYLDAARALAAGRGFVDAAGAPLLARTPGYPLWLVPGVWLGAPVAWALLTQLLLGAALVPATRALAREAGLPPRAVAVAAWWVALDPWLVVIGTRVLSETLCVLLVTIGLRDATAAARRAAPAMAARAGLWLALAAYVRPIVLVAIAAAALGALTSTAWPRRQRLAHALALLLAAAALLAPWVVRNGALAGSWSFSSTPARALYLTLGGTAQAAREGRDFSEVRRDRLEQGGLAGRDAPLPPGAVTRAWADVRAAPIAVLRSHAAGMLRVVLDPGGIAWLRSVGAYPPTSALLVTAQAHGSFAALAYLWQTHPGALVAMAVSGVSLLAWPAAVIGWRSAGAARGQWALVILALTVASGGVHGSGRFRVIFLPVLLTLAAAGLLRLARYTRGSR